MSDKPTAVELIRKFQQLFSDLNHKQIAERLVKLLVVKRAVSRVACIVLRDENRYVQAVANHQPGERRVNSLATALDKLKLCPSPHSKHVFSTGDTLELSHTGPFRFEPASVRKNCQAGYIQPIAENGKTIAAFYLETERDLPTLRSEEHTSE